MAEPNPNPNPNPPPSLLSTLGEELVRIITPVSACMLLVVLLVLSLSQSQTLTSSSPSSIATIAYSESTSDSTLDKLKGALFNSLVFVAVITVTTFLLLLLFYFRFTTFLKSYLSFSVFVVLAFLGGQTLLLLIQAFTFPIDIVTFLILLANISVVGVMAVFLVKMPLVVTQGYLVVIGVLVAYWFTMLPEWTTWALLVAMSVYDLAAVLLPGGPLRLLVELAISRDEELPALVYEARPVEVTENSRRRIWRGNQNSTSNNAVESAEAEVNQSSETSLESSMESVETETETRLVIAEERRVEVEVEVGAGKARFIGITGLPLEIFTYVLDRVPAGCVDVVLSYCHYGINDTTLLDLVPYFKSKGVGIITASPLAMGLLTESGPPEWHPALPELKDACKAAALHCKEKGKNISKLALKYSLMNKDVSTVLVGMNSVKQVEENVIAALEVSSGKGYDDDDELLREVEAILGPVKNQTWPSGIQRS